MGRAWGQFGFLPGEMGSGGCRLWGALVTSAAWPCSGEGTREGGKWALLAQLPPLSSSPGVRPPGLGAGPGSHFWG